MSDKLHGFITAYESSFPNMLTFVIHKNRTETFILMLHSFKITQVFFLAMIKYFYAPLYGVAIGMGFWENFFALIAGGTLAFTIYYYFSYLVIVYSRYLNPYVIKIKIFPARWQRAAKRRKVRRRIRRKNRKKFSWQNKFMVKLRRGYGMWGIILLTPVLLSLPVGAFLLRKYYRENKFSFPIMIASIVVEGFLLCIIYWSVAHF